MSYSQQFGQVETIIKGEPTRIKSDISKRQRDAGRARLAGKIYANGPLYLNNGRSISCLN